LLLGLTLVVGLALGLGGAYLAFGRDGGDQSALGGEPSVQDVDLPSDQAQAEPASRPAEPDPSQLVEVEAATSPEAAVSGFLAAEALGEFEQSYAFLSEGDLVTWPTVAEWVAAHADFQPVSGFEVTEVRPDGTVLTSTALRSSLDPILGLVPARALGSWPTVESDGGVRVRYGESSLEPRYPSDEGVVDAVRQWVTERVACNEEAGYGGTLYGAPDYADQLCGAEGEVELGEAAVLQDSTATTTFLQAFGPEVFSWARTVPVRAPLEMTAVVAPIDDQWEVIGVMRPA